MMNTENSRVEHWTVTCMNSVFLVTQLLFSSVTVIVYQIIQIKPRTGFIEGKSRSGRVRDRIVGKTFDCLPIPDH